MPHSCPQTLRQCHYCTYRHHTQCIRCFPSLLCISLLHRPRTGHPPVCIPLHTHNPWQLWPVPATSCDHRYCCTTLPLPLHSTRRAHMAHTHAWHLPCIRPSTHTHQLNLPVVETSSVVGMFASRFESKIHQAGMRDIAVCVGSQYRACCTDVPSTKSLCRSRVHFCNHQACLCCTDYKLSQI